MILHDHTKYRDRDGERVSNRFEKLVFKVPRVIDIPVDAQVIPVDVVATVYGEFQNQLAVKCARIDEVKSRLPRESALLSPREPLLKWSLPTTKGGAIGGGGGLD